ncbi:MAG TPA: M17 family peptidase N-terminal domain-containing protein, partial [Quisquiliibacterium sp.]|nr:M17 family peptidase N-terminal domain-containing protein [Quisquiliibacterium sp.]
MQFSIKTSAAESLKTACAVVPVLPGRKLGAAGAAIDNALGGALATALGHGDLPAKAGSTLMVYGDAKRAARVLLVSMGEDAQVTEKSYSEAVRGALRHLGTLAGAEAVSLLHETEVAGRGIEWRLRTQVALARDAAYRFDRLKSKKEPQPSKPDRLAFLVERARSAAAEREIGHAVALANGIDLAKDLGNLPGNVCTPGYLAGEAVKLAAEFPELKVEVLEHGQIEALGMGSFLSVTRGSDEPPRFIVFEYRNAPKKAKPV